MYSQVQSPKSDVGIVGPLANNNGTPSTPPPSSPTTAEPAIQPAIANNVPNGASSGVVQRSLFNINVLAGVCAQALEKMHASDKEKVCEERALVRPSEGNDSAMPAPSNTAPQVTNTKAPKTTSAQDNQDWTEAQWRMGQVTNAGIALSLKPNEYPDNIAPPGRVKFTRNSIHNSRVTIPYAVYRVLSLVPGYGTTLKTILQAIDQWDVHYEKQSFRASLSRCNEFVNKGRVWSLRKDKNGAQEKSDDDETEDEQEPPAPSSKCSKGKGKGKSKSKTQTTQPKQPQNSINTNPAPLSPPSSGSPEYQLDRTLPPIAIPTRLQRTLKRRNNISTQLQYIDRYTKTLAPISSLILGYNLDRNAVELIPGLDVRSQNIDRQQWPASRCNLPGNQFTSINSSQAAESSPPSPFQGYTRKRNREDEDEECESQKRACKDTMPPNDARL